MAGIPIIFHIVGYIQHLLKLRVLRERKASVGYWQSSDFSFLLLKEGKFADFPKKGELNRNSPISDRTFLNMCILKSELGTRTECVTQMQEYTLRNTNANEIGRQVYKERNSLF